MDQATVPLIVALISGATTSLGWIVLHYLTRKREIEARESIAQREEQGRELARAQADRTRRLELRLKYYERQIQEFYAPLYSNIQLIWNVWRIGERFSKEISQDDNNLPIEEVKAKIGRTLGIKYYLPLHTETREILKAKLFLVEGAEMPGSFTDYLMHSVMEDVQRRLAEEDNVVTSSVPGVGWPYKFPEDVKAGLDKAMSSYEEIIQELARPAAISGLVKGRAVTSQPPASPD